MKIKDHIFYSAGIAIYIAMSHIKYAELLFDFGLRDIFYTELFRYSGVVLSAVLFVFLNECRNSPIPLRKFVGRPKKENVILFLLAVLFTIFVLKIEFSFIYERALLVAIPAFVEQLIFFVPMAWFLRTGKDTWLIPVIFIIFCFGHNLTLDVGIMVSAGLLLPTIIRTAVDRSIWNGFIFHFVYNFGLFSDIFRAELYDGFAEVWINFILLFSAYLFLGASCRSIIKGNMLGCILPIRSFRFAIAALVCFFRIPHFVFSQETPVECYQMTLKRMKKRSSK